MQPKPAEGTPQGQEGQVPQQAPRRRFGCLRGCLICLVLYFVFSMIAGWIFSGLFPDHTVELQPQTVYRLQLKGTLVEQAQDENPFKEILGSLRPYGSNGDAVGLDQILGNIRLAKNDERILGIWLDEGQLSMGPASAKAIRDALIDFKTSGKWVVASATSYGVTNYYVATAADCIFLDPTGEVAWNGLSAQKMYFTRLLDKIGVEMQILKVGSFKSAVEPFTRTSMSPEDKEQVQQYLNGIWAEYKATVGAARHLTDEQLEELANRYMGLASAEEQKAAGLVDSVLYTQEMDSILRIYTGTKAYHMLTTGQLAQVERKPSSAKDKVAVVYLEGEIVDEGSDGIVATEVLKTLRKISKDDAVKAVVLRVNSPGGSADASERIWYSVKMLQAQGLPVVVSMGDLAASGGYYISCGADYIFAEPTTLTGSIGIFGTIPNVKKLRDKVGLDIDGIGTNTFSSMQSNMIYKGMNSEERAKMQAMIERGYDLFTRRCAEGRHVEQSYIKSIAEGRVWLGNKGKELGLVDDLGGLDKAVAKAVDLAHLQSYQVVYYPEVKDFMDELLSSIFDEPTEEELLIAKIRSFASKPRIMALMPLVEIQ